MRKFIIPALGTLFIFIASCSRNDTPVHVRIIETTDVHGVLFPYDYINDREIDYSLAQVHNYVSKSRNVDSLELVLVDNGDILQGQPTVYHANYIDSVHKHLVPKVMNYMKYDLATIGNHDIEAGHKVYDKVVAQSDFSWLAANAIVEGSDHASYFEPYEILERKGKKIAFLGLVTPGIPNWLPRERYEGIRFDDMVASASYWIPRIRSKENPDLIVGLFHAGFDYTYGGQSADTERNQNASILVAKEVPGFDIIMIGHDHNIRNEKVTNKKTGKEVLILSAGSHARNVAVADVAFSPDREEPQIEGSIIDMTEEKASNDFMQHFSEDMQIIRDFVNEPITFLDTTLASQDAFWGKSAFLDLVHHEQLNRTGAQLSFTAPLGFNNRLEKGTLYVRDMFNLYRFENFLYAMQLSGSEIDDYLEFSYARWFQTMQSSDDHALRFRKNDEGDYLVSEEYDSYVLYGRYYNYDAAAGIDYTVDLREPEGERVTISGFTNGEPFYKDSIYQVALNSYRGNGGGGHLTAGVGLNERELEERRTYSSEKDIRYYLLQSFQQQDTLHPKTISNWKAIPENWLKKAKQKDKEVL